MLQRLRKSLDEKDQGFTLIELLVVVVIIGVLAAIAIPVFLSQREKAADAGTKSDLKNAATLMETYFVDNQTYVGTTQLDDLQASDPVTVTIPRASTGDYCLEGANPNGSQTWVYDSSRGGLQPSSTTACAATAA